MLSSASPVMLEDVTGICHVLTEYSQHQCMVYILRCQVGTTDINNVSSVTFSLTHVTLQEYTITGLQRWNAAIVSVVNYTCVFPANMFSLKNICQAA